MSRPKKVHLVAQYFARPRKKHATAVAGYMKDVNNIQWDEQVNITVGLKDRDLVNSRIVLNISDQSVVKNSFQTGKTFMELFQYFYTASPQEISQKLQQVGITIGETKSDTVQEDVRGEEKAGEGSEPSTATEPTVA
jgi:hypothetical protein